MINKRCKNAAWLCTLVYFASYVMRINFAVMIVKICSEMAMDKSELSVVLVGLTVSYGAGQIISGFLGDKVKPVDLLFYGVCVATLCNVAMFFCHSVAAMTVVWCINGLAHAMLWPPMVRLLASNFSDSEYLYSAVRVSWGSSIATILLYLVCPMLLYIMSWRYIILICASVGAVTAIVWRLNASKIFNGDSFNEAVSKVEEKGRAVKMPVAIYVPLILIMLGILSQGVLRDGVTNWMPSYMMETFGMTEENSILTAVIPAIFSIIAFEVFGKLQQKLIKNEVLCACSIFGLASVSALVMYLVSGGAAVSTLLMSVIIGCMHGVNLMLITVVPKRFVKYGRVSTVSGVLNACTYVGSSISTYGFAVLAENKGWGFTVGMWAVIAAVGMVICLVTSFLWKRYYKS
jgi:OPA family glycerol-3-phosphate transporter-like MFS transporter